MIRATIVTILAMLVAYFGAMPFLTWRLRRKVRHFATISVCVFGSVVALIPLFLLITYLFKAGLPGLNVAFFTQSQKPLGEPGGGFFHAIVGSLIIVGIATLIGVPVGVLCGIWLSEVGKGRSVSVIRFLADVLTGLPSIIAGILGYELIVSQTKTFSGLAGSIALSILMIPVITRVTEESLKLVPKGLREASLGLGAGKAQTILRVVLPAARSGIFTGVILAVARVGGETAPLLFTAAGQSKVIWNPSEAMAALPLSIYLNSSQPFDVSQQLALTGALVLVLFVALVNVVVKLWVGKTSAA